MKISETGGEFALIDRLAQIMAADAVDIIQGIGDDAAVLRVAPEPAPYLLVTTDLLVDERHFKRTWADPVQIGVKAAECNISDIAAMGGRPTWMLASLVLAPDLELGWVEALYHGLAQACRPHGIAMVGGDTSQGDLTTISITLLGSVSPDCLRLRSHARPGDVLMVTGTLGASAAALNLLRNGQQPNAYLLQKYLTPRCRLDLVEHLASLAGAMIDISDGLGSEVRHICKQSHVGAEIYAAQIPLHADVLDAGATLGMDPLEFALSGGEDYELLFSITPEKLPRLKNIGLTCYMVGKITASMEEPVLIRTDGTRRPLPGGYDHFR